MKRFFAFLLAAVLLTLCFSVLVNAQNTETTQEEDSKIAMPEAPIEVYYTMGMVFLLVIVVGVWRIRKNQTTPSDMDKE